MIELSMKEIPDLLIKINESMNNVVIDPVAAIGKA